MSKKTTVVETATSRSADVGLLIKQAGKAADSMLAKCKEAAKMASSQLNPALPLAQRIESVVLLYAEDFKQAGHNVKALFKDALTLHAAAQTPVSVEVIGKDGKKAEEQLNAEKATELPKHAMREAAKQVREAHGMARKPAAKKPATVTKTETPKTDIKTESDQFSEWLGQIDDYLQDSVFHQRIVAHLISLGYNLGKAAQGRVVQGKAAA
jgi:hypothetical protein